MPIRALLRRFAIVLNLALALALFLFAPGLRAQEPKAPAKPGAPAAKPAKGEEIKSIPKAPPRAEGEGPWPHLILRGVTVIDGTGAPPYGPVDIVIEKNRIVKVQGVGNPGLPIDPEKRPKAAPGDKEIDL